MGWIVVLLYAVCIVLRLARYNALLDDGPACLHQAVLRRHAGARAARSGRSARWRSRCSSATAGGRRGGPSRCWMIAVSLLVVSRIPMRKIHTFAVPPNCVAPLLALLAIATAAAFVFPYLTDPGDHRRLRLPHPVHGAQQAVAGRTPGSLGRQTQAATAGAPRHPPGASRQTRRRGTAVGGQTSATAARRPSMSQLSLTARLNTSALDSRRGVVRLHPEAVAALGIREWDAVSLTGSRTTAAVVGLAGSGHTAGHRTARRRRRCPTRACVRTPP